MIEGNKIILRPLIPEDAPFTLEVRHDLEANQALIGFPYPVNLENEKEWISSLYKGKYRDHVYLAIEVKETKIFAGYLSAKNINTINRTVYFGIILRKKFRGKGYSLEAIRRFTTYLYQVFNIRKILLEVISDNLVAINLYKKCGFIEEGILQKQVWNQGDFKDVLIMSLFLGGSLKKHGL